MPESPEEAVREFLERYAIERRAGNAQSLEEYQALWPGYEREIAASFETEKVHEAAAGDPEAGTYGPYRVIEELGRGGQATVYLAEDTRLGRRVALKVLRGLGPASEELLRRFEREASATARLDHPGICAVHDTGVTGGVAWIAMRHVEGRTLAARIQDARTSGESELSTVIFDHVTGEPSPEPSEPPRTAPDTPTDRARILAIMKLVEEAARALHAAHEAGVVHRDVKPGNVMVTPDGHAVVLDFGLARLEEEGLPALTLTGDVMGTPAYMSPEQLTGHGARLDRRTDVYSLGIVLFECLTLVRPFEAPTREALYQTILSKDPPNVRKLNRAVPDDLKVVVETALEKDRDRRYQTALDLAEELRRIREREPILARPAGPLVKLQRWTERNPVVAALLLLVALVTGGAVGVLWKKNVDLDAQTRLATERAKQAEREKAHADRERARAAFTAGLRSAARGRWRDALVAYDEAAAAGFDPVAVGFGRVDAWIGQMRPHLARAELGRLRGLDLTPAQGVRILPLEGDLVENRLADPDAGLDAVRQALEGGLLDDADAGYARALLAETWDEALGKLETVLEIRPTHRLANELYASLLTWRGAWPELAAYVPRFRVLFPEDPGIRILDAALLTYSGETERARTSSPGSGTRTRPTTSPPWTRSSTSGSSRANANGCSRGSCSAMQADSSSGSGGSWSG